MTLQIRGRRPLLGSVAIAALALAVAFAWEAMARGSELAGWLSVGLGVIASLHGLAFRDARRPLFDADESGARVRTGSAVWGFAWDQIDEVVILPASRISDGLVTVTPVESARPSPPRRCDRWSLRWNAWRYDSAFSAPHGLVNSAGGADVSAVLERLAPGKVRMAGRPVRAPSTVAVRTRPESTKADSAERPTSAGAGPSSGPEPSLPERRRTRPRRESIAASSTDRRTGRRTELAIPTAVASSDVTAVAGNLALSSEQNLSEALPEAGDLHRRTTDNISLIIDDTTALSAQAMSRVRRPVVRPPAARREGEVVGATDTVTGESALADAPPASDSLGAALACARTLLGVSIDELAERTRIRPHVIECLERNDASACGGDVYARGHVRMLARALGLDPEPLVEQYNKAFATQPVQVRDVFEAELSTGTGGLVKSGSSGPRWGVLVGLVLVLVIIWTLARYLSDAGPTASATHVTNTQGLGSPGAGNRLLPGPPRASAVLRGVGGESRVTVVDRYGRRVFDGLLKADETHRVGGVAPLKVTASDGSVVGWTAAGKDRGLLAPIQTDAYRRHVAVQVTVTVRAKH
jgi:cytoskeleton protein RodZ